MLKRTSFVVILLLSAAIGTHASEGRAVFSSYTNEQAAKVQANVVAKDLSISTEVISAVVNGRDYYRVASKRVLIDNARNLISEAKLKGYVGAWLAVSEAVNAPTIGQERLIEAKDVSLQPKTNLASLRRRGTGGTVREVSESSTIPSVDRTAERPPVAKPVTVKRPENVVTIQRMEGAVITLDGRVDESAVSYTHQTLPTIYSV